MRVGLLDKNDNVIEGRYVDDCMPIEGDHIDKLVEWKTGYDAKDRAIKPTKMRIEMKTPASSPSSSKSTINRPAGPLRHCSLNQMTIEPAHFDSVG